MGKRWNQLALAVVHVELPAVIRAFQILTVKPPAVQRHAAMRTSIAQSEGMSLAVAPDNQGDFQQRGLVQLIAMHAIGGQGAIPEARQHQSVSSLALRWVEFGHGKFYDCWMKHTC